MHHFHQRLNEKQKPDGTQLSTIFTDFVTYHCDSSLPRCTVFRSTYTDSVGLQLNRQSSNEMRSRLKRPLPEGFAFTRHELPTGLVWVLNQICALHWTSCHQLQHELFFTLHFVTATPNRYRGIKEKERKAGVKRGDDSGFYLVNWRQTE